MINIIEQGRTDSFQEYLYPYIIQIGTGGTGGYLVQHIAQILGTSNTPASYMIVDPDVIEEKNLGNQLFLEEEIGLKKAEVLASRYSHAYNIDIASYSVDYIESTEQIKALFNIDYMRLPSGMYGRTLFLPIFIGCVDNNYTRKLLNDFFQSSNKCIYIDAGNEATTVPADWQRRPKSEWTEDELFAFNNSGWSGQIVTGVKLNEFTLAPVAGVFPDILADEDSIRPSELSCSELSASEPQRSIVNKFAALGIANILSQIVEEHTISTHVTFLHAKKGYMRSIPIEKNEPTQ